MNRSERTKTVGMLLVLPLALLWLAGTGLIRADEGMWTFDNPPLQQLKERYGFEPDQKWLDHVRLSSVRFNDGGSGSFVSADGLVLTNHHVALGQLQKISSPQKNYVRDGFLARSAAEELPCPDLELNVLVSMTDVTAQVQGVVKAGMSGKEALEARKARMAQLEKEGMDRTGLRSDVVTLYLGGEYWLYQYRKYREVHLVFAPEQQAAFYGGDPDNFTYPRYDLDMALFRVYDNGQPFHSDHFLKWNTAGAADGELVFVSGHPGSTDRLYTLAQLETQRDFTYALRLKGAARRLAVARQYSARGPEEARQAAGMIFGIENGLKAMGGEFQGLKDPALLAKKARDEKEFRRLVAARPEWQQAYGDAWDAVAGVQLIFQQRFKEFAFRRMPGSRLPGIALQIVQFVAETGKPDGQRLEGFHDSQLDSLRFRLFSPAPIYPGLEEALLADGLKQSAEELGATDPFVQAALGGKTAEEAARDLIAGTKLADPALRRQLVEGGAEAVAKSDDPLIALARRLDPFVRELRKWHEDNIESVERSAGEKIGAARFAVYGKSAYPDATFTLRLSYGTVKGYPMNGTQAPPKTTFYGIFDRSAGFGNQPPFQLPSRYIERKDKLDLATPLDFVCSADIIGGNSGSPVVNRTGELVGLVFDGNIESLVGRFVFDETDNRTVSVHSAGMIEALRKLYDADFLADELLGKK